MAVAVSEEIDRSDSSGHYSEYDKERGEVYGLGVVLDYQGERYEAEPFVMVENRAIRLSSSMRRTFSGVLWAYIQATTTGRKKEISCRD